MAKLKSHKAASAGKKKTRSKFRKTNNKKGASSKPLSSKKKKKDEKKKEEKKKQSGGKKGSVLKKRKADEKDTPTSAKKPKLTAGKSVESSLTRRELHKKKLSHRKELKFPVNSLEKINKAKQLWEHVRRHKMEKPERDQLINEMMSLINSHIYELTLKHDTARIIQCALKFGGQETRDTVYKCLKDHIVELSKLKYAKFVIKALFRYCTQSQRSHLISCYYTHVQSLTRHREAAELIELAYNEYANASERALLVQEFYGPKFALFKDGSGQTLSAVLSANPEERDKLVNHMKHSLMPLLDKSLVGHNIVHQAMLEFIVHANESLITDIMERLREVAVQMLHTREGAKVNLHCLWNGTTKDRKVYVKSLKGVVTKICKEEHGHLVLLGIFDCIDDTVFVTKTILAEMISSLNELVYDKHARRVLLYLLNPRSPQHFSHQFLQLLTPGDSNRHSKKPQATRWAELRAAISPHLIKLASERAIEWACDKPLAPLLIETVSFADGDTSVICSTLCEQLMAPLQASEEEEHLVNNPCGHWVLKRLLAVHRKDISHSFADTIIHSISADSLISWTNTNRGCFVLASLVSESSGTNKEKIKEMLRPLCEQLRTSGREGADVLLKTIQK